MPEHRLATPSINWDRLTIFRRAATEADWEVLNEACQRCNMYIDQFILQAAIAEARRLVPPACQTHADDVGMPPLGLFSEKKGGGVEQCPGTSGAAEFHRGEGQTGK